MYRLILSLVINIPLFAHVVLAQRIVAGRLVDKETEVPIANTEVRIVGKDVNTFSNKAGYFQLEIEDTDSLEIINSYYLTYIMAVPNVNNFRVSLIKPLAMEEEEDNEVYMIVDDPASFPGGIGQFFKYIKLNMKTIVLDKSVDVSRFVYIVFIIEKDGKILPESVKVVQGFHELCDNEALRLVQNSPDWIPGKRNGKPVRSTLMVPIKF